MVVRVSYVYTAVITDDIDIPQDAIEEFKLAIKNREMDFYDAVDYFHNNIFDFNWLDKNPEYCQDLEFPDSFFHELIKLSKECPVCASNRSRGDNYCAYCGLKL